MNDGQFSSMTKAMIEAAKADAPSAAARANVWSGVSATVGGAVASGGAGATAGAATVGGVGAAKLLVIGALLGGTVTVGLAVTMLRVGTVPAPTRETLAPAAAAIATSTSTPTPTPTPTSTSTPTPTSIPVTSLPSAPAAVHPKRVVDALAREAQLVSEARTALAHRDPGRALQAIRAARALPSHQLAPEELAVEAQALRALGRTGDATEVDEALRSKFPESALAR